MAKQTFVTTTGTQTLTGKTMDGASNTFTNLPASAPTTKVGTFSQSSASTTTTTVAHGLGTTPKIVRFHSSYNNASASVLGASMAGVANGTSQFCSYMLYNSNGATHATDILTSGAVVLGYTNSSNGDMNVGSISLDATNITITWTKTGSPTGTWTVGYEAT